MKITLFVAFISFLLTSCASNKSIDQQINSMHHEFHIQSTTKNNLEKVIPLIENLQIGTPIEDSGLTWSIFKIGSGDKTMGLSIKSDGWLKLLSGGLRGGFSKLGKPVGLQNGKVVGEHVFGYSWSDINMVPKYIVETEAKLISENEYNKDSKNANWTYTPGTKDKIYFKNVVVKGVAKIEAKDLDLSNIKAGELITLEGSLHDNLTEKSYKVASDNRQSLVNGMTMYQVVSKLNGKIIKHSDEEAYYILNIGGFLNNRNDTDKPIINNNGMFVVWPFGFISNGETNIRTVLIFKNGKLIKQDDYESEQKTLELISKY